MNQPSPVDMQVWTYHLLGWSTRRIAGEVDTSQSTVTRIIQRIKDDPEYQATMAANDATIPIAVKMTPPDGFRIQKGPATVPQPALPVPDPPGEPVKPGKPRHRQEHHPWPVTFAVLALIVAFAALCFAAVAWKTAHNIPKPIPGPRGATGQQGPRGHPGHNSVRLCVRFDNVTGDVAEVYGTKTDCGPNRLLISVP